MPLSVLRLRWQRPLITVRRHSTCSGSWTIWSNEEESPSSAGPSCGRGLMVEYPICSWLSSPGPPRSGWACRGLVGRNLREAAGWQNRCRPPSVRSESPKRLGIPEVGRCVIAEILRARRADRERGFSKLRGRPEMGSPVCGRHCRGERPPRGRVWPRAAPGSPRDHEVSGAGSASVDSARGARRRRSG